MTTAIKLPLRSLNESVIRDLKEKYPEAEISVELHQDRNKSPLSEAAFWEIISLLDWSKEGNDEAIVEPVIVRLAAGPIRHIFEFADILSEKLYALDARTYAQHIGEDAWSPDQYFSVDNFLYARCCVIANGKDLYDSVLHNPAQMPKDLTFEALLYLPSEAYERKTGNRYDYTPSHPIETYSNQAGWSEEMKWRNRIPMGFHGNSRKNDKEHHLYAIHDKEEGDVFKYGISDKPIGEDGCSQRMREQVDYLNRAVGWGRYFAEIMISGIAGNAKARQVEDDYINAYRELHGRNPRGNVKKTSKQY